MKHALALILFAAPATAQDYAVRTTDRVPSQLALSDMILDRDLEYFDGGVSRYAADGTYAWTYAQNNGGGVWTGVHDIQDRGVVCVAYDAGPERCDMFVISDAGLTLLTAEGQRFPLRDIR